MKIEMINNKLILFLNKYILGDICLDDAKNIENYFKKVIFNLMKYYDIKLMGEYNVQVHIDDIYGIIMELEKLSDENLYDIDFIDMKIIFNIKGFVIYEVDDYDYIPDLRDNIEKYYYNNKYYCVIKNIDETSFLKFLEYCKMIYGNNAKEIIAMADKIK